MSDMFLRRRSIRRRAFDLLTAGVCRSGFLFSMGLIVFLIAQIIFRGGASISLEFLTSPMRDGGLSGGILYQICGTMILIATAGSVAAPLALGLALLETEYVKNMFARRTIQILIHSANAIPSILFGLFGFFALVKMAGLQKSWLAGGLVLGMMILPTTAVAVKEAIDAIPSAYREQAIALGLSKPKEIFAVVLPRSFFGLITGLLLGLSRAAGETAPVMFTACVFYGPTLPHGIRDEPILSLPYHVFNLAQDSLKPQAMQNAWGASLVLIMIVSCLSLTAWGLRRHQMTEAWR